MAPALRPAREARASLPRRSSPGSRAIRRIRRGDVPWVRLLPHRQLWAIAAGKFLTDPIWWFYLFWSAKFFADRFGADLKQIGPPLITIYLMADVGSIVGGWFSSWLLARGWTVNAARKTTLFACAVCVIPVSFAPVVSQMWVAVLLIGLAAAAHQGFAANIFTLASDMFPRRAVGSVIGIAGMFGAVGGILMQAASGRIKEQTGSYLAMFVVAGSVYVFSVLVIHGIAPRLSPVELPVRARPVPEPAVQRQSPTRRNGDREPDPLARAGSGTSNAGGSRVFGTDL